MAASLELMHGPSVLCLLVFDHYLLYAVAVKHTIPYHISIRQHTTDSKLGNFIDSDSTKFNLRDTIFFCGSMPPDPLNSLCFTLECGHTQHNTHAYMLNFASAAILNFDTINLSKILDPPSIFSISISLW